MPIEISDKGIKFDYVRYLADSAPGFLAILILVMNFYIPIITEPPFPEDFLLKTPKEVLSFIGILLFLLATPLVCL